MGHTKRLDNLKLFSTDLELSILTIHQNLIWLYEGFLGIQSNLLEVVLIPTMNLLPIVRLLVSYTL